MKSKILLSIFFLFISIFTSFSQIVFSDNAITRISGGAFVVLNDPLPNAIKVENGGHFITEGDLGTNRIRWFIGANSDTYTVPFGVGINEEIPLTFSTSDAVDANGVAFIDFSTYATDTWKNSDFLPAGVNNFNNANNLDNSSKALDRFYRMEALNYGTKPNLSDVRFSYRDIEHTAPQNIIMEASLGAQRWNSTLQLWGDYLPTGNVDVNNNFVAVDNIANTDLFAWWVLVDKSSPLPVELLSFTANLESGNSVGLKWSTTQEINVNRFDIERSVDGVNFVKISQTIAVGNSQIQQNYYSQDKNLPQNTTNIYYRLKMVDNDASYKYSNVEIIKLSNTSGDWKLYPVPVIDNIAHLQVPGGVVVKELQFFDAKGSLVSRRIPAITNTLGSYTINIPIDNLPSGGYALRVICSKDLIKNFVLIKK